MNETTKNTYKIIIAAVVIVAIVVLAIVQYDRHSAALKAEQASEASMASSTDSTASTTMTIQGVTTTGGHVTIVQDKGGATTTALENAGPIPDLSRTITFPATTQADVRTDLTEKIELDEAALKADPTIFADWINLGLYREAAGDYVGAEQAWNYVGRLYTNNFISFSDLGDLYSYYLKNNVQAEANYLTAIKNGPDQINLYFTLSDFYANFLKNPVKAKAIIEQGLVANPNNPQLEQKLATFN